METATPVIFVGIDVSKAKLNVTVGDGPVFTVENAAEGHAAVLGRLAPLKPRRVLMEATGGLESALAAVLYAAGLAVMIVNPRQARSFADGMGYRAKTDAIDARMSAHFAECLKAESRPLPEAAARELDALLDRRRQLVGMRVMEQNRKATSAGKVLRDVEGHLDWLDIHIEKLDKELDEKIRSTPAGREKDDLLRGVPGIGPVTSRTLPAALSELGTVSNRRVAALVGLAPLPDDSGKHKRPRHIRGGRREIPNVLYMVALATRRHNPTLKAFAERLTALGKKPKVVLVAVAHKLLVIANAIIRSGKPWDETLVPVPKTA